MHFVYISPENIQSNSLMQSQHFGQIIICCEPLLHNVGSAMATRALLKMNCSVELEDRHPWPYLIKMLDYARESKV